MANLLNSFLILGADEDVLPVSNVPVEQWWLTCGAVVLVLIAAFAFSYFTRTGIIARATTKEAIRQPVFALLMFIAFISLLVNTFLPVFSFGEDVKMLKDCGLATLLISGLLLAVWTASTSIASEIEGKTAMTLLSKPINRRQFIVGKYVGIVQAVMFLLIPLMVIFCLFIFYKVGYDAREHSKEVPAYINWDWRPAFLGGVRAIPMPNEVRMADVNQIIPGLMLIILEISVLTAVSVAISTRGPMVVNMVSCLAIFVVGHLTPILVQSQALGLEQVAFVAKLVATILPSLEIFNMQAAVATGTIVPPVYLGYSAIYCAAYCAAAILLAFILFEDRDLA